MGAAGVTRRGGAHNSSSAAVVEDKKEPSEARTTKRAKGSSSSMKQVLVRRLTRRGPPRVGTGSKMGVRAHMSQARGTRCFMLLGAPASNSPLTESLAGYQTASTSIGCSGRWPLGPQAPGRLLSCARASGWPRGADRALGVPLGRMANETRACAALRGRGALSQAHRQQTLVLFAHSCPQEAVRTRTRQLCALA